MEKKKFKLEPDIVRKGMSENDSHIVTTEIMTQDKLGEHKLTDPSEQLPIEGRGGLTHTTFIISSSLKKEFKKWCLINDVSMTHALSEALKLYMSYKK